MKLITALFQRDKIFDHKQSEIKAAEKMRIGHFFCSLSVHYLSIVCKQRLRFVVAARRVRTGCKHYFRRNTLRDFSVKYEPVIGFFNNVIKLCNKPIIRNKF